MNILVYGAGAVGLGLGSCLLEAGEKVTFIGRPGTVAALKKDGLRRGGIFGEHCVPPHDLDCAASLTGMPAVRYDFILVTVKSFDSRRAAEDISGQPAFRAAKVPLVLCQNGWGNPDIFREYFPKERIYNARIITGFTRPRPNEVTITVHADSIRIGSVFRRELGRIPDLCRAIGAGGLPCEPADDIAADLWAKMLYNCALNPLSAVLGVNYGELGRRESSRSLMDEIIKEVFAVMAAEGCRTHWKSPEEYLKVFYGKMLPATAGHDSSMLQDLRAGKRTEIDGLTGMIVSLAAKHRLKVPANRCVYRLVKFLEDPALHPD